MFSNLMLCFRPQEYGCPLIDVNGGYCPLILATDEMLIANLSYCNNSLSFALDSYGVWCAVIHMATTACVSRSP